jgi:C1A family cysteine protease
MYASSFEGRPLTGCLFEASPAKGPILDSSAITIADLPRLVDLRSYCTAVEDQGQTNSCVANASVGAMELLLNKAGRGGLDLSRMFLYFNARVVGKSQQKDEGCYINHAMAALLAHGICEERMWPFMPSAVNVEPNQGCFENATHYEALQFARTPNEAALKSLAQELPVVFGVVLPTECYQAAGKTGMMPHPQDVPAQNPGGGHAMLMVGYNLDQKTYIVRNSWGAGYGEGGYIHIPFDVIDRYAHPDQFYTIGAIEQAPGLKIFGEAVAAGAAELTAKVDLAPAPDLAAMRANVRGEIDNRLDAAKKGFADRLRGN